LTRVNSKANVKESEPSSEDQEEKNKDHIQPIENPLSEKESE